MPSSQTEQLERLRDLGRTMQGGSILVLGRRRLYPVRPQHQAIGQVSAASCEAALDALASSICQELLDEGYGLDDKGVAVPLLQRRGTLGVSGDFDNFDGTPDPDYLKRHKMNEEALRKLATECAVNIAVSPGMQLVAECGLDPVLYQPTFVVCIGGGQLRVLTFAFVGGPVSGDRPDRKRTPFAIRLATDDLVALSRTQASKKVSKLRYAAHAVDPAVQTSLDMIVILEEELFQANEAQFFGVAFEVHASLHCLHGCHGCLSTCEHRGRTTALVLTRLVSRACFHCTSLILGCRWVIGRSWLQWVRRSLLPMKWPRDSQSIR